MWNAGLFKLRVREIIVFVLANGHHVIHPPLRSLVLTGPWSCLAAVVGEVVQVLSRNSALTDITIPCSGTWQLRHSYIFLSFPSIFKKQDLFPSVQRPLELPAETTQTK